MIVMLIQMKRQAPAATRPMRNAALAFASALAIVLGVRTNASSVPQQDRSRQPGYSKGDSAIDALFSDWNRPTSPGCAVRVLQNGSPIYTHGYGMADLNNAIPISAESVFQVASLSKQFTATALLMLARDGKLALEDPVRRYVREVPAFDEPITLRQLADHTSGIRDQWELLHLAGWRNGDDVMTDGDVLQMVSRQRELNFRPGTEFLYSNTGYTLLAQTVSRVSGQSFREFTSSHIFGPLGMGHTHFRDNHAEIVTGLAHAYESIGGTFQQSDGNNDTVGPSGLLTTVDDLGRWDENFYHPRVADKQLLDQLETPGVLSSGQPINYAFGLSLGKYHGLQTVDAAGADAGYRADLLRFPQEHFSVVMLCNLSTIDPRILTRRIADILLFHEAAPSAAASSSHAPRTLTPTADLAALTGTYLNTSKTRVLRVGLAGGELRAQIGSSDWFSLHEVHEGVFKKEGSASTLEFPSMANGKLSAMWRPEGQAAEAFVVAATFVPTDAQLAEFAGRYSSEELDRTWRLTVSHGRLVIDILKQTDEPLRELAPDVFETGPFCVTFLRNAQHHVIGFEINSDRSRHVRFVRVDSACKPS